MRQLLLISMLLIFNFGFADEKCDFFADDGKRWHVVDGEWAVDVTIESYGGQSSGTFNNGPAFSNAMIFARDNPNTTIIFQSGQNYFFSTLAYAGFDITITNLTIRSSIAGQVATCTTNNLETILSHNYQNIPNWELRDMRFTSTEVDAGSFAQPRNEAALVKMNFTEGVNHRWIRCEFSAIGLRMNAMKYYIQVSQQGGVDTTLIDGIYFEECDFTDVGRFSIEVLGIPQFFRSGPYVIAKDDFPIRNIHIKDCNFSNNPGGYAISLVNGIEGVLIEGNTMVNTDSGLELAVENCVIRNNYVGGTTGNNFTFGGDYEGPVGTNVTVNWPGNDYDIYDNVFEADAFSDIFVATENVRFRNNIIRTWGIFLVDGNTTFENNDIYFTGPSRTIRQQDADSYGIFEMNNNNIYLETNLAFSSEQSGIDLRLSRNNVYVVNSANFPVGLDVNVDNRKFVNSVQTTDYGWTGTDRGVIGYVAPSTVTPPSTSGSAIRQKIMRQFFNW